MLREQLATITEVGLRDSDDGGASNSPFYYKIMISWSPLYDFCHPREMIKHLPLGTGIQIRFQTDEPEDKGLKVGDLKHLLNDYENLCDHHRRQERYHFMEKEKYSKCITELKKVIEREGL